MDNITLLTVNWNQQPCVELLLKSYVVHHYTGKPLKLCLVDNGSTDNSKHWLNENGIPYISLPTNVGHENALNVAYTAVNTRLCLLNDTDVEYRNNVYGYSKEIQHFCISVGELINNNFMNDGKVRDRISPWFWMFDMERMKLCGNFQFRDPKCEDWSYDVGSWHWERMSKLGFTNFNLQRKEGNQDTDLVSMRYDLVDHIGKVSWNLDNHEDRYSEVMRRRRYVSERLEKYKNVSLKGVFCL